MKFIFLSLIIIISHAFTSKKSISEAKKDVQFTPMSSNESSWVWNDFHFTYNGRYVYIKNCRVIFNSKTKKGTLTANIKSTVHGPNTKWDIVLYDNTDKMVAKLPLDFYLECGLKPKSYSAPIKVFQPFNKAVRAVFSKQDQGRSSC